MLANLIHRYYHGYVAEDQQAQVSGSNGGVLGRLIDGWSQTWNTPLKEPLSRKWRLIYAASGSYVWAWFNITIDYGQQDVLLLVLPLVLQLGLSVWFGVLISYQERRCSPSRFFIEGLLFPRLTVLLLTFGKSILGDSAKLIFGGE